VVKNNIKLKTCSKCKKEYPATKEYFKKDCQKSDGLCPSCKICVSKYRRKGQYEKESPELRSQISKMQYYMLNDKNRLSLVRPKLAKEWNYEKNYPLTPTNIACGSDKIVWWKCKKCNQEWLAAIYSRKSGSGCSYCAGKIVDINNCLATMYPKIAKEWHPTKNGKLTPYGVTKGNTKKVWWKCKKGHEWETNTNIRTSQNTGCPYCNRSFLSPENNLAVKNPKIAKKWHPTKNGKLTPYDVTPLANTVVWWKCKKGHEWKTRVSHINKGVSECPYCSKIELKDGTFFASQVEAFWYLSFKKTKAIFSRDQMYPKKDGKNIGRCRYDFYFPNENLYIEVTGYNEKSKYWKRYIKKIRKKKKYVKNVLKSNFVFIQYFMTPDDYKYVQKYLK